MKLPQTLFFTVVLSLCAAVLPAVAQVPDTSTFTDISTVVLEFKLQGKAKTAISDGALPGEKIIPGLPFTRDRGIYKGPLTNGLVTKRIFVQFSLYNSADTVTTVYFCPGFYFRDILLYRLDQTGISRQPSVLPPEEGNKAFRQIRLNPGDSATYVAELLPLKTYNNKLHPRLIGASHVKAFLAQLHAHYSRADLITYLFCGLLLMMILFSLTNFFQGGNKEFLYYSGYALFLGGLLFLQTLYHLNTSPFGLFLEGYFDFILQGTGIVFYILFMKKFLETGLRHPFLSRLYNTAIILLAGSMLLFSLLHYFSGTYVPEFLVESMTKILLLILVLAYLGYGLLHWNDHLLRYLFWGNFFLFLFSAFSQLGILFDEQFKKLPGLLSSSVLYYEIGIFLELAFFLAGLNYKNRQHIISQTREREALKAQNLLKEYEKEIAVYKAQQEERQRISADMHDELGAGMTAIRLMSEIARNKMKENTPLEIEKISQSADDVLNKMNAIIWSMNSGNDTLDNLVSYIRSYAIDYFENTPFDCRVSVPDQVPGAELSGDKRRNVFLAVKETLNNVLKHAGGDRVEIIVYTGSHLRILIRDNGKGIDLENIRRFGNGLKNIRRRMENIGGRYDIYRDNGTVTLLELPL